MLARGRALRAQDKCVNFNFDVNFPILLVQGLNPFSDMRIMEISERVEFGILRIYDRED